MAGPKMLMHLTLGYFSPDEHYKYNDYLTKTLSSDC